MNIRTQDNREGWRDRAWLYLTWRDERIVIPVMYWRPSLLWRIARWWRRLFESLPLPQRRPPGGV